MTYLHYFNFRGLSSNAQRMYMRSGKNHHRMRYINIHEEILTGVASLLCVRGLLEKKLHGKLAQAF